MHLVSCPASGPLVCQRPDEMGIRIVSISHALPRPMVNGQWSLLHLLPNTRSECEQIPDTSR